MIADSPGTVTQLLIDWGKGDEQALNRLLPLVYKHLHRQARRYLRRERANHTLHGTALVHEAYLRLIDQKNVQWQNRAHFFAIAAGLMRRILVDHARKHLADKRKRGSYTLELKEAVDLEPANLDVIALDDGLEDLAKFSPQQSRIVELRFFAGLSIEETSEVLGVSPSTVKRDWALARAWLSTILNGAKG